MIVLIIGCCCTFVIVGTPRLKIWRRRLNGGAGERQQQPPIVDKVLTYKLCAIISAMINFNIYGTIGETDFNITIKGDITEAITQTISQTIGEIAYHIKSDEED